MSEPEPNASIRRSARLESRRVPRCYSEPQCPRDRKQKFSGSITSRATSLMNFSIVCEPEPRNPRAVVRVDIYHRVLLSRSACVSAHSVEPSSPGSHRPGAQMIVRWFQPVFSNSPSARPSSIMATWPLSGSAAPLTHPS